MTVRIEDVARAAGVSTATVSRALRGLPSVSAETQQIVRDAAAELGYVVSRSASSLASGRTLTVGLVTPYASRWYYATVIEAVERELRAVGYDALLVGVGASMTEDAEPFRAEVLRGRVDGLVILTAPLTGQELDGLRRLTVPIAFVGAGAPGAMSVRIDDLSVGRTATQHLLGLGHAKIAYVGGDPADRRNFAAPLDRRAGWLSAMREAGLDPPAPYAEISDFTAATGRQAMERLLELPERPTAVFAASDDIAFGVLSAARDAGCRVPGDMSVIGVDDHEISAAVGLTTIAQPVAEHGRLAAKLVLAVIGGDDSRRHEHVVLPTSLVCRETTGPPR
ncbi:MAG: LacI family transcriptional regulator, repressor for deo operon, udp, cdd, tsx, nupC, and nupG [Actinomycetota bacterium]|jgi:DNA-binding LacI/PurR family transcriptional regulator|nr:LacI family transcriptional regulator, repressor for deo operon, udp, cdd, tsx, nupC, and nupG [Actinomycetota bacterium]